MFTRCASSEAARKGPAGKGRERAGIRKDARGHVRRQALRAATWMTVAAAGAVPDDAGTKISVAEGGPSVDESGKETPMRRIAVRAGLGAKKFP